jgi:hypothetical protein
MSVPTPKLLPNRQGFAFSDVECIQVVRNLVLERKYSRTVLETSIPHSGEFRLTHMGRGRLFFRKVD